MSIIWGVLYFKQHPHDLFLQHKLSETFAFIKADRNYFSVHHEACLLASFEKFNSVESVRTLKLDSKQESHLRIVADCRIDNRTELLNALHISDVSVSDTEVILESYKKWGRKCVDHLIGAFVFAIWDNIKKSLFCVRDQIGVRPLFYAQNKNVFAFCSEKKGLLLIQDIDKSINQEFVVKQFVFENQKYESTFYKSIKRFSPSTAWEINQNGGIDKVSYWDLDEHKTIKFINKNDYVESFLEKMTEAVRCRLRSNNNVGVELSGGLDSSGITAVAQNLLSQKNKSIHAFALLMPDSHRGKTPPYDDNKRFIEEICNKSKIRNLHVINTMTHRSLMDWIDLRLNIFDGTSEYNGFGGVSGIKELAPKHNVNVILSGFLGDELVSSYCRAGYKEYLENGQLLKFFHQARNPTNPIYSAKTYSSLISYLCYYFSMAKIGISEERINSFLEAVVKKKNKIQLRHHFGVFLKQDYYSKYLGNAKSKNELGFSGTHLSLRAAQKGAVLRDHTSLRIESENLKNNYFGIEGRYPMADIRLLEYMLALPIDQKCNREYGRLLYRRGMSNYLPKSVVWRKEEGNAGPQPFDVVDATIMHPQLLEFMEEIKQDPKFNPIDIDKMITQSKEYLNMRQSGTKFEFLGMNRINKLLPLLRSIQNGKVDIRELNF